MSLKTEVKLSQEIPLEAAYKAMFEDKQLHDIELKGNDGVVVSANKSILSVRSPVFRAMFSTGGDAAFSESPKSKVVEFPLFLGQVLRAVVQYCYTNDADILLSDDPVVHEKAGVIASLVEAANHFDLAGLYRKADEWIAASFEEQPMRALAFLNEAGEAVGFAASYLEERALGAIRNKIELLLETESLADIHPTTLEMILKDKYREADEYALFKLLQSWAKADDPPMPGLSRHDIATRLTVQCIHLEAIDPQHLSSIVESSGLVTSAQMLEAYKRQTLSLYRSSNYGLPQVPRLASGQLWRTSEFDVRVLSGDHRFELLECAPLRSGVHKWSIRVEKNEKLFDVDNLGLGVASTSYDRARAGAVPETWLYWADGDSGQDKDFVVRFVLDLQETTGTLHVSVDNGGQFEVLDNLPVQHDADGVGGFVPCTMSSYDRFLIHFLGFEQKQNDEEQ